MTTRLAALLSVVIALGVARDASGQPGVSGAVAPGASSSLPAAPTAPIASGDSIARHDRALRYLARGDAALAAGMRDTARVAWENALYEYPPLTDAALKLATMLVEDGQGYYARRVLERALHYDPHNPKLLHFSVRRKEADSTR